MTAPAAADTSISCIRYLLLNPPLETDLSPHIMPGGLLLKDPRILPGSRTKWKQQRPQQWKEALTDLRLPLRPVERVVSP